MAAAARSVGSSQFIINFSAPRKAECQRLRNCLGEVVATTMQSIAEQTHAAQECEGDKTCLNRAIWYPIDYIKACQKADQLKRLQFMQDNGHLASGYLSGKHFAPLKEGDQRIHWSWLIKKDVLPSEAITAARQGVSILDCGTVCIIAQYTALLEVLGEEKFNRLFSHAVHGQPMVIDYKDHELQPMSYFVSFTEAAKKGDDRTEGRRRIERGQIMAFVNHPNYQERHCVGMDSEYNVSCLVATPGSQTFVGHGLPSQGVNEREMRVFLADRYNENTPQEAVLRFPDSSLQKSQAEMVIALERLSNQVAGKKISEKDVPGLDCFTYQDFNVSLLYDLIKTPVEKVTMQFVRNHPEAKATIQKLRERQYQRAQFNM